MHSITTGVHARALQAHCGPTAAPCPSCPCRAAAARAPCPWTLAHLRAQGREGGSRVGPAAAGGGTCKRAHTQGQEQPAAGAAARPAAQRVQPASRTHGARTVQLLIHLARALRPLGGLLRGREPMRQGRVVGGSAAAVSACVQINPSTWQQRQLPPQPAPTLPRIFLRSFFDSVRCHLGSQRSGSGGGPGLAGSKLQRGGVAGGEVGRRPVRRGNLRRAAPTGRWDAKRGSPLGVARRPLALPLLVLPLARRRHSARRLLAGGHGHRRLVCSLVPARGGGCGASGAGRGDGCGGRLRAAPCPAASRLAPRISPPLTP